MLSEAFCILDSQQNNKEISETLDNHESSIVIHQLNNVPIQG